MLKRTLALALLLTAPAAVPVPAHAAGTGIGAVTIAWSDATHTKVRITWTETAPVANTVAVETGELGKTTAAQPDQLVLNAVDFPKSSAGQSLHVTVTGTDGTEAVSVAFDSYVDPGRGMTMSFLAYDQLRWTLRPDTTVDTTPNDPLDLPDSYRYVVSRAIDPRPEVWSSSDCTETTPAESTAPTGVIPRPDAPFELRVRPKNEWGTWQFDYASRSVNVIPDLQVTGPTATPYGGTTTLTGHVDEHGMFIEWMPQTCDSHRWPLVRTDLVVHQRTSPTAPWTVVGTTRTGDDGNYVATFRNPGPREYRVVAVDTIDSLGTPRFGADSFTHSVRSTTRVVSAKFIQPTVNLGTQPQAYLWVDPPGSQKAALQFKNASGAWQGVTYKTLYAGRGLLTFPWNKRGTTQFRWVVPATGSIAGTSSGTFTLTVR
ncbi:hypothetical protein [Kribbella sp. DT2]|uniref:hypothetical protein n=1 Tax=Kribbella sp. DT2 TaxID=3393427 RepID=UPI003CE8E922